MFVGGPADVVSGWCCTAGARGDAAEQYVVASLVQLQDSIGGYVLGWLGWPGPGPGQPPLSPRCAASRDARPPEERKAWPQPGQFIRACLSMKRCRQRSLLVGTYS